MPIVNRSSYNGHAITDGNNPVQFISSFAITTAKDPTQGLTFHCVESPSKETRGYSDSECKSKKGVSWIDP